MPASATMPDRCVAVLHLSLVVRSLGLVVVSPTHEIGRVWVFSQFDSLNPFLILNAERQSSRPVREGSRFSWQGRASTLTWQDGSFRLA